MVSNQTCFQIENDSVVEDSFCDDGNPRPDPEIKICCEDVCESKYQVLITRSDFFEDCH